MLTHHFKRIALNWQILLPVGMEWNTNKEIIFIILYLIAFMLKMESPERGKKESAKRGREKLVFFLAGDFILYNEKGINNKRR